MDDKKQNNFTQSKEEGRPIKENFKLFFIESHKMEQSNGIIYFSNKNSLECGSAKIKARDQKSIKGFVVTLYSFSVSEIYENNKNSQMKKENGNVNEIIVKIKFPPKERFRAYIRNFLFTKNNFIFDFKFEERQRLMKLFFEPVKPPETLKMNNLEILNFYLSYLKNFNVEQRNKLVKDLVLDSLDVINKSKFIHIDYLLYLIRECFRTELIGRVLFSIKPNRLKPPYQEIKKDSKDLNLLNTIQKNPLKFLDKNKNSSPKFKDRLVSSFYVFFLYLQKEIKDDQAIDQIIYRKEIEKYIIPNLILYSLEFRGIKLKKETLEKMILQSENLEEIKKTFNYISDFTLFLTLLNENFEKIKNIISQKTDLLKTESKNDSIKKWNKQNEISSLALDLLSIKISAKDIFSINDELTKIINYQKINNFKILEIKSEFWESYCKLIDITIDELYQLIKYVELTNDFYKFKNKEDIYMIIEDIIHCKCLYNSEKRIANNYEILDYIKNKDLYYRINDKSRKKSIDILKGLILTDQSEKFYQEFKSIKFYEIFDKNYGEFIDYIVTKIPNMKYFGLFFKIVDIQDEYSFTSFYIEKVLKHFLLLLNNFNIQECPNFYNDIITFYKILELKKKNKYLDNFFSHIESIKQKEIVKDIYIKIFTLFGDDINQTYKDRIIKFFRQQKDNKIYLYVIKKMPNAKDKKKFIEYISDFHIKIEDFFAEEDNDRMIFLKELFLDGTLISLKTEKNIDYIKYTFDSIEKTYQKIKRLELEFNKIKNLFEDKSKIQMIKDRLKIVLICENQNADYIYIFISDNINKYQSFINELDRIITIIKPYFKKKYENEITQYSKIIKKLSGGILKDLADYEQKNIILEEIKKTEEMIIKYDSCELFKIIYREMKEKELSENPNNEEIIFKKSIDYFEKQSKILTDPENIDRKLINNWLNKLNCNENNIVKDIQKMKKIYKIEKIPKEDLIIKKLKCFANADILYTNIKSIKFILDFYKCKSGEIYEIVKTFTNKEVILAYDKIIELQKFFSEKNINIYSFENKGNNYYDNFINIFRLLNQKEDSIKFLMEKTYKNVRHLHELLDQTEGCTLNNGDIEEFSKCILFINSLGNLYRKKDIEIISIFKEKYDKNPKIILSFNNYAQNYNSLMNLYIYFDPSQSAKKKVTLIYEDSIFILKNGNNIIKGTINKTKEQINSLEKLEELNSKMYMSQGTQNIQNLKNEKKNNELEKINEIIAVFSKFTLEISNLGKYLKLINNKSYPKKIKIKITVLKGIVKYEYEKEMTSFAKNNKNKNLSDYEIIFNYLRYLYRILSEEQLKAYKKNEFIRYLSGKQFKLLTKHLKGFDKNKDVDVFPFLRFFTNNLLKKDSNYGYIEENIKDPLFIIDDMINNISEYLKDVLDQNKLNFEEIYKEVTIKENNNNYKGLYTFNPLDNNIDKEILITYLYLTKNLPIAQTILMCNEETSEEEFTAFFYRAIKCGYNVLFVLSNLESLSVKQCNYILYLLDEIIFEDKKNKKKIEMNSCFLFIYRQKNLEIIKQINKKYGCDCFIRPQFNDQNFQNTLQKLLIKTELIESDRTGIGKSRKIENYAIDMGYYYIYFPLGGVITRNIITNRLLELTNLFKNKSKEELEKIVIHLDLYETKQESLMKDFLFSMIITKLYGKNEKIIYIPKEIMIKIEIPNGYRSFREKYKILDFIKRVTLNINQLPKLLISNSPFSNIQIVCNYLKLYDENRINYEDLYIEQISEDIRVPNELEEKKKYEERNYKITKSELLSAKQCENLIKKYLNIKEPNYYQITTFINILAGQLKKLTNNPFLTAETLSEYNSNDFHLKELRSFLIESFIKNTQHFSKGAFESLIKRQDISLEENINVNINEDKDEENAINALSEAETMISYDNIEPSLVFFHEAGQKTLSIITNCSKDKPEYQRFVKLYCFQSFGKEIELPNYKNFSQKEFYKEIKTILGLNNKLCKDEKDEDNDKNDTDGKDGEEKEDNDKNDIEEKNKNIQNMEENNENDKVKAADLKSIEEIAGGYIFTSDNFIKMILILLRIRESVPIIMMGETGCGKTSLIRKLSELINNGEQKMAILNIHAGTNNQDIIDFIENVTPKAIALATNEKIIKEQLKNKGIDYQEKKFWIFLDEINTCNSMGLISEILCKHSLNNKPINENITFIAACNPYRRITRRIKRNGLIYPGSNERKLVYTVNPLPYSLLNFVLDFGNLTPNDEKRYIESIINETLNKYKATLSENEFNDLKKETLESLDFSHHFVRENGDVSSVSLREIKRFNIFFEFFVDYIKLRKEFCDENKDDEDKKYNIIYKNITLYDIYKFSVICSIYICYYLRLYDKTLIASFERKLNGIFGKFITFPNNESTFLVDQLRLDKGIAKNNALKRNIFTLFSCINSKVPIFVVGKPGCSKSLSVKLIFKEMDGKNSHSDFFKKFPSIIMNCFQGSENSTSEGVKKIFDKARNVLKNIQEAKGKNCISLIFFDEMGLAERSENNPLKVIHSELEYDLNEGSQKIAFVGISNWELDASKMNRGVYLSIPEPTIDDINETSKTIAESYDISISEKYDSFLINLSKTYFEYKKYLQNKNGYEDYHGNRDFYHLINSAVMELALKSENNNIIPKYELESISIKSIERNLSGLTFEDGSTSEQKALEIFNREINGNINYTYKYDVVSRIIENLKEKDSRYLLIITDNNSMGLLLIKAIIEKFKNEYKKNFGEMMYFTGSLFKEDQTDNYTLKALNRIQKEMDIGNLTLLSDLDKAYPALYELFNQNFYEIDGKRYTRIALGYSNNQHSHVNEKFKCIVIANKNNIKNQQPPFLNRFEKHEIFFESLLTNDVYKKLALEIFDIIKELVDYDIYYDLSKIVFNCNLEEIQGLVYLFMQRKIPDKEIKEEILKKFIATFPQDIIAILKFSEFNNRNGSICKFILDTYEENNKNYRQCNFYSFLKETKSKKNIIYTFSDIIEQIDLKGEQYIKNKNFPDLDKVGQENLAVLLISNIYSENELESCLFDFFQREDKKVLILKFSSEKIYMMNSVNIFIDNYIKAHFNQLNKIIIYIVHLKRKFESNNEENMISFDSTLILNDLKRDNSFNKSQILKNHKITSTISHLVEEINQIFIDNLNGQNQALFKLLKEPVKEILNAIDLNSIFDREILRIISQYKHIVKSKNKFIDEKNYLKELENFLIEDDENNHKQKIIDAIKNNMNEDKRIMNSIIAKKIITTDDVDIANVLFKYITFQFKYFLKNFIYFSEKNHFISILLIIHNNKKLNDSDINLNSLNFEENFSSDSEKEEEINPKNNKKSVLENSIVSKIINNFYKNINIYQDLPLFVNELPNIKIILDFKIPCLYGDFNKLSTFIQNEIVKGKNGFIQNERTIRITSKENDELNKLKDLYYNKEETFTNNTYNEINNCKNLNILFEEKSNDDFKDFMSLLLSDYILFYIEKYNIINYSDNQIYNVINILKNILKLRFNKNTQIIRNTRGDEIKMFAVNINWLEGNLQFIQNYFTIYSEINHEIIEKNNIIDQKTTENYLYSKIMNNLDNINYVIDDFKIKDHHQEFNEALYKYLESIIMVIFSDQIVNAIKNNFYFDFINSIKKIYQAVRKIENQYRLNTNTVFLLNEFLNITNALHESNNFEEQNMDKMKKILILLKQNNKNAEENDNENLNIIIDELYEFLSKIIKNNELFNELVMSIFTNEFKKIKEIKVRKKIFEIILKNDELIKKSFEIIEMIFKEFVTSLPEKIVSKANNLSSETNEILKIIENINNPILDEVIIYYFEMTFSINLSHKEQDQKIPLELLKISLSNLEKGYLKEDENKKPSKRISILYSLAFVRTFLNYLINKTYNNNENKKNGIKKYEDINNEDIIKLIDGSESKIREMIYLYIYKIIYNLNGRDIVKFNKINLYYEYQLNEKYYKEFYLKSNRENKYSLSYFLLPDNTNDINNYLKQSEIFKNQFQNLFKTGEIEEFQKHILANGIDNFYLLSCNYLLSNINNNEFLNHKDECFSQYSRFANSVLNLNIINKNLSGLLNLFIDPAKFENLKKNNGIIHDSILEKLFYSMRFCINSFNIENNNENNNNEKYFYSALLTPKVNDIIAKNFIIGNHPQEKKIIKGYGQLKEFFKEKNINDGVYICTCGECYTIAAPGFPKEEGNCSCGKPIGIDPKTKKMIKRDGYFRVFENEDKKKEFKERNNFKEVDNPNILLDNFYNEYIKEILNNEKKGINKISNEFFENDIKFIRSMSQITYRILNFIFYSHLFFANELGYMKNINDYLPKVPAQQNITCLDVLMKNWEILEKELKIKGIDNIKIFLISCFSDCIKKLKNITSSIEIDERNNVETEIENLISDKILLYHQYEEIYNDLNKKLRELDLTSMKNLLDEVNDPSKYKEEVFPYYKYLLYCTYPYFEMLKKQIEIYDRDHNKYPIIYAYLNKNDQLNILENLPLFNDFVNEMNNRYSYKITRNEAKKIKLNEEYIYIDEKKLCDNFINMWNKNKKELISTKSENEIKRIPDLNDSLSISNFLVDKYNNEHIEGYYLYLAYNKFIECQNNFLEPILNVISQDGLLNEISEYIKTPLDVNNADKNDIISFKVVTSLKGFNILFSNSFRNINKNLNGNLINYGNYKTFNMNFKKIEEKLGELLLDGKKLFNKDIDSVVYINEEYLHNENHLDLLQDFKKKYKNEISKKQKLIVYDCYKNNLRGNLNKCIQILKDCKIFMFYTIQNIQNKNTSLEQIINKVNKSLEFSKEFNKIFSRSELLIKDFYECFIFIEKLCFELIKKEMQKKYNDGIKEDKIKKMNLYFSNAENENCLITRKILATMIRKIITRYLINTKPDKNAKIMILLNNYNLWEFEISENKIKFEKEIKIISNFHIKFGQIITFYDYLGGDLENFLDELKKENNNVNEKNGDIKNEENRINDIAEENEINLHQMNNLVRELNDRDDEGEVDEEY